MSIPMKSTYVLSIYWTHELPIFVASNGSEQNANVRIYMYFLGNYGWTLGPNHDVVALKPIRIYVKKFLLRSHVLLVTSPNGGWLSKSLVHSTHWLSILWQPEIFQDNFFFTNKLSYNRKIRMIWRCAVQQSFSKRSASKWNFLARSANLPEGLSILLALISFFFLNWAKLSHDLLDRFSRSFHQMEGICVNVDYPVHFFPIPQGRLPWQPILCRSRLVRSEPKYLRIRWTDFHNLCTIL